MKTMRSNIVVFLCGASVVATALCGSASAAAETNLVTRPRSVFIDDPKQGRDPFFPDSVRRAPVVAQTPSSSGAAPVANPGSVLQLKGISGSKSQPFALINNATLGVGESTEIRAGSQVVTVRCREIRDRSVLVEIGGSGEIRELKLREGI